MSHCAPRPPKHGFLDHGCAVYGGIQLRSSLIAANLSDHDVSSARVFAPQFNLAYHWNRPFLVPHSLGFPNLLTKTSRWTSFSSGDSSYISLGCLPMETKPAETRMRNLLAGVVEKNSVDCRTSSDGRESTSAIRLWAVNEFSNHRELLEFDVRRFVDDDGVEEWRVCREWDGEMTAETATNGIDAPPRHSMKLPSGALELRKWEMPAERCSVAVRTKRALHLCNPGIQTEPTTVMHSSVVDFTANPYMPGEIVLLDGANFIWYGEVGRLCRAKCAENTIMLSASDHPRIVYVADSESVQTLDLRTGSLSVAKLFFVPDLDTSDSFYEKRMSINGCFDKPTLKHLHSMNEVPRMLMAITTQSFYLIDERMPGLYCIDIPHSTVDGNDFILESPAFIDPVEGGRVVSFYVLKHIGAPDAQHLALYEHRGNNMWSSLAPTKRLSSPSDSVKFWREQMKYGIQVSKEDELRMFGLDAPLRAIEVVGGLSPSDRNDARASQLLFKMTANGHLWYETLRIIDDSAEEERTVERCAAQFREMMERSRRKDSCVSAFDKELEVSFAQKPEVRVWNVVASVGDAGVDGNSDACGCEHVNPLGMEAGEGIPVHVEPVDDPDRLISRVVTDIFRSTSM